MIYVLDEDLKARMPEKNSSNDQEKELTYCKELEKCIELDQALSQIPAVKEKLDLLKETIEDTQENYTLSKDKDAKWHKSADSSFFFGYNTHLAMSTAEQYLMGLQICKCKEHLPFLQLA